MNIESEIAEYRYHVLSLTVNSNIISVTTLENIQLEVQLASSGYYILSCSVLLERTEYDDLGQILTTISPAYRDSFSNELFSKLTRLS